MTETAKPIGTRCNLCGESAAKTIVTMPDRLGRVAGEFRVLNCVNCGTWRIDPEPGDEDWAALYPDDYDPYRKHASPPPPVIPGLTHRLRRVFVEWAMRGKPSFWTMPLRELPLAFLAFLFSKTPYGSFNPLAYHGEGRKLLDVGCGTGDLLCDFRMHGWSVFGIEASERASEAARERGLPTATGRFPEDADKVCPWAPFSAVTFGHVIEHLRDPGAALRAAHRLLEPGGFVLIWTPVSDGLLQSTMPEHWYNLDIPRHFHLFTRRGLALLAAQSGFRVLSSWPATSARSGLRSLAHALKANGRVRAAAWLERSALARAVAAVTVRILDAVGRGDVEVLLAVKPRGDGEAT